MYCFCCSRLQPRGSVTLELHTSVTSSTIEIGWSSESVIFDCDFDQVSSLRCVGLVFVVGAVMCHVSGKWEHSSIYCIILYCTLLNFILYCRIPPPSPIGLIFRGGGLEAGPIICDLFSNQYNFVTLRICQTLWLNPDMFLWLVSFLTKTKAKADQRSLRFPKINGEFLTIS